MDVRSRKAYAVIKIKGVADPIQLTEGVPIASLLSQIGRSLAAAENRYEGFDIMVSFKPIAAEAGIKLSPEEQRIADIQASWFADGLVTEPDPEADAKWARNPQNPKSPNYDRLYHEWCQCDVTSTRLRKTPAELRMLVDHVVTHYTGTEWYDGITRW